MSVVGADGVGKTRLALRAATEVRDAHADGVRLTELSPLRTAGLVGLAVMETLRLDRQSTRPVVDVITERAHRKRLLIVLDSGEHLGDDMHETGYRAAALAMSYHEGITYVTTRQ
ncbi:hypothetical protein ABZT04_09585 [Streptomyces sp. NPDC005492]|uniref:hypothetical protein n=1 Tax=Streptomyces sp. NPDC005492 TaxID=3156883 RepID=UPI0033B60BE3